jgi:hypothetical protein
MIRLITDETGPMLLNIENQTFARIPETFNKFFKNGKMFDFFDTITEFILSGKPAAVIPFWALAFAEKGKRYNIRVLVEHDEYTFWNVERIGGEWVQNNILNVDAEKPYFGYFIRSPAALNECTLQSTFEIKKAGE